MATKCHLEKEFQLNEDKFEIVSGGDEFFHENGLQFPDGYVKEDQTYKTMFGPIFYHPGAIYSRCDDNLRLGSYRLLCVRKPEIKDYERYLGLMQSEYVRSNWDSLIEVYGQIKKRYSEKCVQIETDVETMLYDYLNAPHKNRKARLNALREVFDTGEYSNWCYVRSVLSKIKIEWGKVSKIPRLYVSLGIKSILCVGHLVPLLKSSFASISMCGATATFADEPTKESLKTLMKRILYGGDVEFIYFSDDSCIGITCVDGSRFVANLDISSCDGSHYEMIFEILRFLVDETIMSKEAFDFAVEQCLSSLRLISPQNIRELVVIIKPLFPVLYTGSTLTTIINNIASLLIFTSIVRRLKGQRPNYSDCRSLLRCGAEDCGYIVTIDECLIPQQLQFLKHSPMFDTNGELQPILNIGVILRMWGNCWGDLPGKKKDSSLADKAYACNRQLMLGLVHAGDHGLTRALS